MVLCDTNIPSTFAKVGRLDLLLRLFADNPIAVVAAVQRELARGVEAGLSTLRDVLDEIASGAIPTIAPNAQEEQDAAGLPASFDAGERDTISVAASRGYGVLANEKRVRNWAQSAGIPCWDLPGILRLLWRTGLLTTG